MSPVDEEIHKMIMDEFAKDKEEVDRFRKERVRREIHDTRLRAQQQTTKKLRMKSNTHQPLLPIASPVLPSIKETRFACREAGLDTIPSANTLAEGAVSATR